jgi:hypothetical protein
VENPSPPNVSDLDLAYAAGVIDSDGFIGIRCRRAYSPTDIAHGRRVEYHYPEIGMAMADPIIPYWFKATFGGTLVFKRNAHRGAYCWQARIRGAAQLVRLLRPYLKLKGPHADLVLALIDEGVYRRGGNNHTVPQTELERRRALRAQMLVLNSRTS